MSCETFLKTVGEKQFSYTQLSARKSLLLKLRIGKVFSGAMPDVVSGLGKSEKRQIKMFISAVNEILTNNSAEQITDLIFDIVKAATINEKAVDVDSEFSGDLMGLYDLCFWILKKEYGDFLAVAIGSLGLNPVKTEDGKGVISQT